MLKYPTISALCTLAFAMSCATLPAHQEPDPITAQNAWIDALSSGDSTQVWRMLGTTARARFKDQKTFDTWCRLYCAELLVEAVSAEAPWLIALIGETRLSRTPDGWKVESAPGIHTAGTRAFALQSLYASLAILLETKALAEKEQQRLRSFLAEIDSELSNSAAPTDSAHISLRLEYGTVELQKSGDRWEITSWALKTD